MLWMAIALCRALALAGCSHESADWKSATAADTSGGLPAVPARSIPTAPMPRRRRRASSRLQEDRDWQAATAADTRDAYEQFVTQHADSKWAQEARIRIENFAQSGGAAGGNAGAAATRRPLLRQRREATPPPPPGHRRQRREAKPAHAAARTTCSSGPSAARRAPSRSGKQLSVQVSARTRAPDAALRGAAKCKRRHAGAAAGRRVSLAGAGHGAVREAQAARPGLRAGGRGVTPSAPTGSTKRRVLPGRTRQSPSRGDRNLSYSAAAAYRARLILSHDLERVCSLVRGLLYPAL